MEICPAANQREILRGFQIDKLVEPPFRNLNLENAHRGFVAIFLVRVAGRADHVAHRLRQIGLAKRGAVVEALVYHDDLPLQVYDNIVRLRVGVSILEQLLGGLAQIIRAANQLLIGHVDRRRIVGKRQRRGRRLGRCRRSRHVAEILSVEIHNLHVDDDGFWRDFRRGFRSRSRLSAAKSKKSGNHKTRQKKRLDEMSSQGHNRNLFTIELFEYTRFDTPFCYKSMSARRACVFFESRVLYHTAGRVSAEDEKVHNFSRLRLLRLCVFLGLCLVLHRRAEALQHAQRLCAKL